MILSWVNIKMSKWASWLLISFKLNWLIVPSQSCFLIMLQSDISDFKVLCMILSTAFKTVTCVFARPLLTSWCSYLEMKQFSVLKRKVSLFYFWKMKVIKNLISNVVNVKKNNEKIKTIEFLDIIALRFWHVHINWMSRTKICFIT